MDGGGYNGDVSVIDKRRGDNSAQNGLVEYTIEPKPEIKKIFEEGGMPTPSFNQLKKNDNKAIDTFKNAIAKAKQSLGGYGASVELKDDYTDINLYLSQDGESGFGIKPNGDIVSVFSNNKAEGGRSHYMLEMATAEGGRQLDCFDIYLTKIYEAHGFKPVAKMKWNDEYIPEGWNKENFKDYNNGEPALTAGRRHVVFMVYDPNNDIEKKKKEAEEKYGKKNEIPYIVDYDMGEDAQHMYKWRSPAEREAIYNNMLERYKNAKSTEELKKVFSNSDKPFLRQMDDLNSLSKEQAQSIQAEYSKRYLELIKEENPEEYKKHKKYLEKKYNIKSDASIYIDSLIDIIEYIDAKKKDNIPAGTEWRTLKNGEHILVNSATGEVIKGAGGSLNNKDKNKKENNQGNKIVLSENDFYKINGKLNSLIFNLQQKGLINYDEKSEKFYIEGIDKDTIAKFQSELGKSLTNIKDNEYKEIDFNNIKKVNDIKEVKRAEETLNKFYHKTLNYNKDYLREEMRNHLKYLDEDGKFAPNNSSKNKSKDATSGQTPNDKIKDKKDNDKKDNDIEITDNDRYEYLANVYARIHGYEDNKLLDAEENAIRKKYIRR